MRNVLYIAPFPMETTLRFARALAQTPGVRLLGLWQRPPEGEAARQFHDITLVGDAMDRHQLLAAVQKIIRHFGPLHRIVGILENLQEEIAWVREQVGVEGMDVATAQRFRDKGVMKEALRKANIPCARHARLRDMNEAWAFVDQVGFPVVLKPPAGAGSRATYKCGNPQELHAALTELRPSPAREVLAEEFLTGVEHSFEALTLNGEPLFHSITRYYPSPLEVMREEWIQWCVLAPRDIYGPEFDEARRIGVATIKALGLHTGITHMEWFRRPDGSVAVGEIAARPPGAQIVKVTGYAYDVDLYRAWARLMIDGAYEGPWERKYAVGVAFLRGAGRGRVAALDGLEAAQKRMGSLVIEAQLPQIGQPKSDGYEGEGYAIVRHPDTDVVRQALLDLITTVKVRYA